MLTYKVNNSEYQVSYKELKEWYETVRSYSDAEFVLKLPEIIHLTCMLCWFKEVPMDQVIGDEGIVHQLAHLLHIPNEPIINLVEIRNQFNNLCKLD